MAGKLMLATGMKSHVLITWTSSQGYLSVFTIRWVASPQRE